MKTQQLKPITLPKTFCSVAWEDIELYFDRRQAKFCCRTNTNFNFPTPLTSEFLNSHIEVEERRADLLSGLRHSHCEYCWKNEDTHGSSYRTMMSINDAFPIIFQHNHSNKKIIKLHFDNTCNQSCLYCSENFSSLHADEKGIKLIQKRYNEEDFDAVISWLESRPIIEELTLAILGGEPTISKGWNVFYEKLICSKKLIDRIIRFNFTTNVNYTDKIWEKNVLPLIESKKTPKWQWMFSVSNESTGEICENVRYGLKWETFKTNFEKLVKLKYSNFTKIHLSMTPNIFTLKDTYNYVDYVFSVLESYNTNISVILGYNWVDWPNILSIKNLSKDFSDILYKCHARVRNTSVNVVYGHDYFLKLNDMLGSQTIDLKLLDSWLHSQNKFKSGKLNIGLLKSQLVV